MHVKAVLSKGCAVRERDLGRLEEEEDNAFIHFMFFLYFGK